MDKAQNKRARDVKTGAPTPDSRPSGPFEEHRRNGPEATVSNVIARLTVRPDRDPETGRFCRGNLAAGRTLARSEALWDALTDAKRELVRQLRSDLAIEDGDAVATLAGLLDAYAEARLLRRSMFVRMVEMGGPITAKGKARALFGAYLKALDRERRLALDLGLERRSRPVDPISAVHQAVKEANR
jgi:hypothetical protein